MTNANYCFLMGNLTADPEVRFTGGGKPVTTFNMAVNRFFKGRDGSREKESNFFRIVTWENLAENCGKFLKKGNLCAVEGRIQFREYTTNAGEKRKSIEIVAENVQFFKGPESGPGAGSHGPSDDPGFVDDMGFGDVPEEDISMDDLPF